MKHLYSELPFSAVLEVITKYYTSGKDVRNLVIKNNNDKKGMIIRVNSPVETMMANHTIEKDNVKELQREKELSQKEQELKLKDKQLNIQKSKANG